MLTASLDVTMPLVLCGVQRWSYLASFIGLGHHLTALVLLVILPLSFPLEGKERGSSDVLLADGVENGDVFGRDGSDSSRPGLDGAWSAFLRRVVGVTVTDVELDQLAWGLLGVPNEALDAIGVNDEAPPDYLGNVRPPRRQIQGQGAAASPVKALLLPVPELLPHQPHFGFLNSSNMERVEGYGSFGQICTRACREKREVVLLNVMNLPRF